jgi:hypothetical protein
MLEVIDLLSAEYFMPKMIVLMKWVGSYRIVIASADPFRRRGPCAFSL